MSVQTARSKSRALGRRRSRRGRVSAPRASCRALKTRVCTRRGLLDLWIVEKRILEGSVVVEQLHGSVHGLLSLVVVDVLVPVGVLGLEL